MKTLFLTLSLSILSFNSFAAGSCVTVVDRISEAKLLCPELRKATEAALAAVNANDNAQTRQAWHKVAVKETQCIAHAVMICRQEMDR